MTNCDVLPTNVLLRGSTLVLFVFDIAAVDAIPAAMQKRCLTNLTGIVSTIFDRNCPNDKNAPATPTARREATASAADPPEPPLTAASATLVR